MDSQTIDCASVVQAYETLIKGRSKQEKERANLYIIRFLESSQAW